MSRTAAPYNVKSSQGGQEKAPKHPRKTRLYNGFTLLEVTLSLALLALALTALSTLQARNLALTAEDRLLTEATLAARNLLTRVQTGQVPLQDSEGDLGEDHPGWRWSIRLEEMAGTSLARMEMILFKPEMGPERALRFWLVVYRRPVQ